MKKATTVMLLIFTFCVLNAADAMQFSNWVGQAYPTGDTRMLVSGQWSRMTGVNPVGLQEDFRTAEGSLSLVLKDGTRLDAGKDSEFAIRSAIDDTGRPSYTVTLVRGRIGINNAAGTKMVIKTPDNQLLETGQKGFIGGLSFDGARTRIINLSGNLVVKAGAQETLAGAAADKNGARANDPASPATDPAAIVAPGGEGSILTGLGVAGGMGGAAGAGVAAENSMRHASPSRP